MIDNRIAVSIVIPFLNESGGINELLRALKEYHAECKFDFEVIFVDDGSDDGTSEVIKNHESLPFVCKLICLTKNFGSHAAVRAGFLHCTGRYITCLPADLQISLDVVGRLQERAREGFDVVCAIRDTNEIGLFEKAFSRLYAIMMRRYVNKSFPYKGLETILISDKVKKLLNENVESNSSLFLQILSMGHKSSFISIHKANRKIGKSKWTFSKKVKILIDSFAAFSFAPIRLVSIIGIVFFILGCSGSLYLILRKLIYNDLASGWPALLSVLLLGFGLTNISLGIIAEYLWRTLDASRKRPVFIIDEMIELKKN